MPGNDWKLGFISDFNLQNLGALLSKSQEAPSVQCIEAPFGSVIPTLLGQDDRFWEHRPEALMVWTKPESVVKSFQQVLHCEGASPERLLEEVDFFSELLVKVPDFVKVLLVPTWTVPSYHRGLGILDMVEGRGLTASLMRMNLRMAERLSRESRAFLLPTRQWFIDGEDFDPRLWYGSKTPCGIGSFKRAAGEIKAALRAASGLSKKLVVVDLDDTLWGGILGDVGWKSLRLGGHDPIGEAYVDFQKGLKTLLKRGIVLGIVSKNEEKSALHAIRNHPEMVLTLDDFAGWRINWNDKAQNLLDLVDEINVGLDSVVFIDDNPVERARVREALPEVLVPEWPDNPLYYQTELLSLNCFDTTSLSLEDLSRSQMYVSERKRRDLGRQAGSLDEWLKTLSIAVQAERLGEANLERAAQLFNKTNQMNLTTRRMTPEELKKWSGREGHDLWVFRVSDRFGDSGLTGIASLVQEGERGRILDFILSCRVMGRRIEETMLSVIITKAKTLGLSEVFAQYTPTTKNKPCLRFFEGSGLERTSADIFRWNMEKTYEPPPVIQVISTSGPWEG